VVENNISSYCVQRWISTYYLISGTLLYYYYMHLTPVRQNEREVNTKLFHINNSGTNKLQIEV